MPRLTEVLRSGKSASGETARPPSGAKTDDLGHAAGKGDAPMNWETFYLVCFLVGLLLSVFSLLGGMGHFGGHVMCRICRMPDTFRMRRMVHGRLRRGDAVPVVERLHADDLSLLVWRGGLSADALRQLCETCRAGAGGDLRYRRWCAGLSFLTRVLMPHDRELTADETEVVGAVGNFRRRSARRNRRNCVRATGRAPVGSRARRRWRGNSEAGGGLRRPLRKRNRIRAAVGGSAGRDTRRGQRLAGNTHNTADPGRRGQPQSAELNVKPMSR